MLKLFQKLRVYNFNTIMHSILLFLIYFGVSESKLWSKGVVHYAVNPKDYDIHSQDEIMATFSALEKEICVKFFNTPLEHNSSESQLLYISNPSKQKNCPPQNYNYTGNVVGHASTLTYTDTRIFVCETGNRGHNYKCKNLSKLMPIGYSCINKNDIARLAIEMLKASIDPKASPINSYDLVKRFEEREQAKPRPTFLTTDDRNYINVHYHGECSMLSQRAYGPSARRSGDTAVTLGEENLAWYQPKSWPYGVVTYSIDESLRNLTLNYNILKFAMTHIEMATCIVFQETSKTDAVAPRNLLVFTDGGNAEPELGFKQGEQKIDLVSMTQGDPGHNAHALNNLMRTLGIPMMSNRFDRDNYVSIQWRLVKKGKERLLEKVDRGAWVMGIPYDFTSVTHAPANYLCRDKCPPGGRSVAPLQDVMWKRSLTMGHFNKLSESDIILLSLVYEAQCKARKFNAVFN